MSSRRLAGSRLGRRHLVSFRRFINAFARLPLDGTRSAWAGRTRRVLGDASERSRVNLDFTSFRILIEKICGSEFRNSKSTIEQAKCEQREQASTLVDNFSSYITDPADEHSFRNHSLATRHSESSEFSNSWTSQASLLLRWSDDITNRREPCEWNLSAAAAASI